MRRAIVRAGMSAFALSLSLTSRHAVKAWPAREAAAGAASKTFLS